MCGGGVCVGEVCVGEGGEGRGEQQILGHSPIQLRIQADEDAGLPLSWSFLI